MQVIKFDVPIVFGKARTMEPGLRYVVSQGDSENLATAVINMGGQYARSNFNSYERRYAPGNVKPGDRIAIYRHNAFGDQLIISALPRYLQHIHPGVKIDLYCLPEVGSVWLGNNTISNFLPGPPTFEALTDREYTQHHVILEGMLEENWEQDQQNCYDDMFEWCGLYDVPDEFKRPHIVVREGTEDMAHADIEGPYLVYQLSAQGPTRTYPPEQGAAFLNQFIQRHEGWRVVLVGLSDRKRQGGRDEAAILRDEIGEADWEPGTVIDLIDKTKSFRELVGLVANADAVVCPDSSIGHLAAAFPEGPKVVSLWGPIHPDDRAKYYKNHFPLMSDACPHGPCRIHQFELPREKCVDASNELPEAGASLAYCNHLRGITPEMILEKLEENL